MRDGAAMCDHGLVGTRIELFEPIKVGSVWICEKWSEEACEFVRSRLGLDKLSGIGSDLLRKFCPDPDIGIVEVVGNLGLNEGIRQVLDLAIGAVSTNKYDNANSRIGVGDSSTAEAATQTDLQAVTNKLYKGMNATFPSRSNQTLSFQSDFLTGEANFVWNEWTIDNGATSALNLNRKVQSLGTKATGTWTLTGQVTLA